MNRNILVKDIMRSKGRGYWAVVPSATVYDALELMSNKDIGALLVMDGSRLVGVFSERDYARKVILMGKTSRTTAVHELMSSPPITASPEMSLHDCMVLMTENHVRHLPVVESGEVAGVLSIGDVVASVIASQEAEIHQLEDYISGDGYTARAAVH